jgi:hypothetical protein
MVMEQIVLLFAWLTDTTQAAAEEDADAGSNQEGQSSSTGKEPFGDSVHVHEPHTRLLRGRISPSTF